MKVLYVRVMRLGDDSFPVSDEALKRAGLNVLVSVYENPDDTHDFLGRPHTTRSSLDTARLASLELCDLVFVGDNDGTGVQRVRALPPDMIERTVVLSDRRLTPEQKQPYLDCNVGLFCLRSEGDRLLEFLRFWAAYETKTE